MNKSIKDRAASKLQSEKQPNLLNSINGIPDKFYTPDLQLASFCKCKGMEIIGVKREGTRFFFVLKDHSERQKFIQEFYGAGIISIAEYRNAIAELKSMLNSGGVI